MMKSQTDRQTDRQSCIHDIEEMDKVKRVPCDDDDEDEHIRSQ